MNFHSADFLTPDRRLAWTEERTNTLRKLWAEGLSVSQIAAELGGLTRNAVTGKLHRIGLLGTWRKPNPRPRAKDRSSNVNGQRRVVIRANRNKTASEVRVVFDPPVMELPTEQPVNPLSVLEISNATCKWPCSGEGLKTVFCGDKTLEPHPYCCRHCRVAFTLPRNFTERTLAAARYRDRKIFTPKAMTLTDDAFDGDTA